VGKFSLFLNFAQGTSKSGKISKPIFPNNFAMLMLFPRFDKISSTKNTNATFFQSEKVVFKSQAFPEMPRQLQKSSLGSRMGVVGGGVGGGGGTLS
jgi:hypothetical protein